MAKFLRGFLWLFLLSIFTSSYGVENKIPHKTLESLEEDLNQIRSFEADFVQKNSDGSIFKGKIFLDRPGKLKFSYDTPKGMVIVSDGENLVYFDPSTHQASYLNIENSPASLLLDEHLDFRMHAALVSFSEGKDQIDVCLRTYKTSHTLTLFIDAKEKIIKGWKTKDPQGNEVEISFFNIKKNPSFCDPALFSFKKQKRYKKTS